MIALTFTVLALAPMVAGVLAVLVGLALAYVTRRRCEAPVEGEHAPGDWGDVLRALRRTPTRYARRSATRGPVGSLGRVARVWPVGSGRARGPPPIARSGPPGIT